jgi:hypothetical protein
MTQSMLSVGAIFHEGRRFGAGAKSASFRPNLISLIRLELGAAAHRQFTKSAGVGCRLIAVIAANTRFQTR